MQEDSYLDIQREIRDVHDQLSQAELTMGDNGLDRVRRSKYQLVKNITGRPLLVYATGFHNPKNRTSLELDISMADRDGFYEIVRNIPSSEVNVDVFIHSLGGSAEATESIVKVLRSRFTGVRFIVTGYAKSAATMLALSGNSILMDEAGELGPIDPQIFVRGRYSPAGSILEQFDKAKEEVEKNPSRIVAWSPILKELAPAVPVNCENAIDLSKGLSSDWLANYMFKGEPDAEQKADEISKTLANEKETLSHARRVDAKWLRKLGVKVEMLEDQDASFQSAIRQLHHAIMVTFEASVAVKIFENSEGAALIRVRPS